jgi:hypothetical protein
MVTSAVVTLTEGIERTERMKISSKKILNSTL